MTHLELDLEISFADRTLQGRVTHWLHEAAPAETTVNLQTRDLDIDEVWVRVNDEYRPARHALDDPHPVEGSELRITVPPGTDRIRVYYRSRPEATGLQWLEPAQTAGKMHPFLYSQGEAIHTRSWIPCVDEPALRITYDAMLRIDPPLRAIMAAEDRSDPHETGVFRFHMPQPIPTYLIAVAAGELEFRALGSRSGVWSEPSVVDGAAAELSDTEAMIEATEKLFGEYRWGRYDVLVLPPAFPLGGMENPRLTFATPTILAGDKSLVSLVAHELAHSWSGNLVTNATWNDFWLNEGFTVYIERRILEAVYGRDRSEMEAIIGRAHLLDTLDDLGHGSRDTWLHLDLAGRDPDEAMTTVPYEKGYLFLRHCEEVFGREAFDDFLRGYFDGNAFRSMTTAEFVQLLQENLIAQNPEMGPRFDLEAWIYAPGLPPDAPQATSQAFERVEMVATAWLEDESIVEETTMRGWTAHEWIHFLRTLPRDLDHPRMSELDERFSLTKSGNSEILCEWLLLCVTSNYEPAFARLESFLLTVGRKKFLQPLYQEMVDRPELRDTARDIYARARDGYHNMSRVSLDKVLGITEPA